MQQSMFAYPYIALLVLGLLLSACGQRTTQTAADTQTASGQPEATAQTTANTPIPEAGALLDSDEAPPPGASAEFRTDFSRHTVHYSDIFSGGPPRDGIPAIDEPAFVSVSEADSWLEPVEPVARVQVGDDVRVYPIQILMWHEIVNDTVGGVPLSITFCPLCNTAIAFERQFDAMVLDFGTTGRLRHSNLIMYDRQTETWWQQGTGDAIVGELAGSTLTFFPIEMIAWADVRRDSPDAQVLSRETGHNRPYGENPYQGYDNINNSPFLYEGPPTPGTLPAVARVLTVDLQGEAVAIPSICWRSSRSFTIRLAPPTLLSSGHRAPPRLWMHHGC